VTTFILNHLKHYLRYSMCFAVFIICINSGKHSPNLGHDICLAPRGFKTSISGPWLKKVVHHWCKGLQTYRYLGFLTSITDYFSM